MAYTTQHLQELEAAIAGGRLSVRHSDGRSVTYQSLDAMRKLRQDMLNEINKAAGTRKRRTMRLYQRGTGL
jgi:hypothetical protein